MAMTVFTFPYITLIIFKNDMPGQKKSLANRVITQVMGSIN